MKLYPFSLNKLDVINKTVSVGACFVSLSRFCPTCFLLDRSLTRWPVLGTSFKFIPRVHGVYNGTNSPELVHE